MLVEGLALAGEPDWGLGVAGAFTLRETVDPVLRTVEMLGFNVAGLVEIELPSRAVLVD